MLISGSSGPAHWGEKAREVDIYDMKGILEGLLEASGLDKWRVIPYPTGRGLTECGLAIEIADSYVGFAGRIRPDVLKFFGIGQDVFVGELDLAGLAGRGRAKYRTLPKYPRVRRDVAFGMPAATEAGGMLDVIRNAAGGLLESVAVFDVYQGQNVPAGTKSIAFALELMSRDKTLTEAEIDGVMQRVVRDVEIQCGATLRGVK